MGIQVDKKNLQSNLGIPCGEAWPPPAGLPKEALPQNADQTLVNHPPHYTRGKIEVILAIEDWKLPYHLGNVVKYVARAPYKGEELQDLKKALWYLNRYVKLVEDRRDAR